MGIPHTINGTIQGPKCYKTKGHLSKGHNHPYLHPKGITTFINISLGSNGWVASACKVFKGLKSMKTTIRIIIIGNC